MRDNYSEAIGSTFEGLASTVGTAFVVIILYLIVKHIIKDKKPMEFIISLEAAEPILAMRIESVDNFFVLEKYKWLVVGNIQQTKKVSEYGFRNKSRITMYCPDIGVRRFPTGQELDIILEEVKKF